MLRLLLGFALLCTYNGGQVTALPHIGPPDVPQSEEPAINIISGKEKRAPILKHQTHWKVLISSKEIWLSQLSSLKNIMAHKMNIIALLAVQEEAEPTSGQMEL